MRPCCIRHGIGIGAMVGATACQCVGGGGPARTTLFFFSSRREQRANTAISRLQSCCRYLAMGNSPGICSPFHMLTSSAHGPARRSPLASCVPDHTCSRVSRVAVVSVTVGGSLRVKLAQPKKGAMDPKRPMDTPLCTRQWCASVQIAVADTACSSRIAESNRD